MKAESVFNNSPQIIPKENITASSNNDGIKIQIVNEPSAAGIEIKSEVKIEVVPINIADPIGKKLLELVNNWDLKDVTADSPYNRGSVKEVQEILDIVNNR